MKLSRVRVVRTVSSERFLLQLAEGEDAAAVDLHYLRDGSVAGTVFLSEDGGITEDRVPELLQYLDEALLPEVSLDEHNLSFTVVQGRVLGDFRRERNASLRIDSPLLTQGLGYGVPSPSDRASARSISLMRVVDNRPAR
jgi:hypothetical protein